MTLIISAKGPNAVVVLADRLALDPNTREKNYSTKIVEISDHHAILGMSGLLDTEYEASIVKRFMDKYPNQMRAMDKYLREENPVVKNALNQNQGIYNDDVGVCISQLLVNLGEDNLPQININQDVIPNFKNVAYGGIGHAYPFVEDTLAKEYKSFLKEQTGVQGLIDLLDRTYKVALNSKIGKEISNNYDIKIISPSLII